MWLICVEWQQKGNRSHSYRENRVVEGPLEAWLHDELRKYALAATLPLPVILWARSISEEAAEKLQALRCKE